MEVERELAAEDADAMASVFSHADVGFDPTGALREEVRTLTVDSEGVVRKAPQTDVEKKTSPARSRRRDAQGKREDHPGEVPGHEDINDDHPDERE